MSEIQFPLTVNAIQFDKTPGFTEKPLVGGKCGDFVAVRPCAPEFENKTFLGVLMGEIALSQSVSLEEKTGTLTVAQVMHNPMIFIPERAAVVFGCGSWWRRIQSEKQLRAITDADISNVWYVKALEHLSAAAASDPAQP